MANSYRTPYDGKQNYTTSSSRRYATTAIIITGALVGGSAVSSYANRPQTNTGTALNDNGQRYYVASDSKRALYPDQQSCIADVPVDMQSECEPQSSYTGGQGGGYNAGANGWYGPVYTPRDRYQPSSQYPSEVASSSNMGKRLPSGANTDGFGSNGKSFTGSKGG